MRRPLTLSQPFLGASQLAPPPGKEACSSRGAAPLVLATATAGTILVSPDFGDVSCAYAAMDAGGKFVAEAHIFILFIHLCSRQLTAHHQPRVGSTTFPLPYLLRRMNLEP